MNQGASLRLQGEFDRRDKRRFPGVWWI